MRSEDLQRVRPGFDDPAMGSQAVFRRALEALSMPGRIVELPGVASLPASGQAAAALLLLALLDSDCSLWLSPSLAGSDAEAWLRFHTGCRCVREPQAARFLWLAAGDAWPPLSRLESGSDEYPDQSATCVMEVHALHDPACAGLLLSGPGIRQETALHPSGLPADFAGQWAANHAAFPRGVDLFLAAGSCVAGLPRSTRVRTLAEA